MLAMGRALMSKPKLILMDEPSMGLSPIFVNEIFDMIVKLHEEGSDHPVGGAECKQGASHCKPRLCTGNGGNPYGRTGERPSDGSADQESISG